MYVKDSLGNVCGRIDTGAWCHVNWPSVYISPWVPHQVMACFPSFSEVVCSKFVDFVDFVDFGDSDDICNAVTGVIRMDDLSWNAFEHNIPRFTCT